ncbi:hypothetical protein [Sphingobium sp. YG1]|jgi:hypothetical protein|nr:hypothetical protein [Sphingobium sp. YG1]
MKLTDLDLALQISTDDRGIMLGMKELKQCALRRASSGEKTA